MLGIIRVSFFISVVYRQCFSHHFDQSVIYYIVFQSQMKTPAQHDKLVFTKKPKNVVKTHSQQTMAARKLYRKVSLEQTQINVKIAQNSQESSKKQLRSKELSKREGSCRQDRVGRSGSRKKSQEMQGSFKGTAKKLTRDSSAMSTNKLKESQSKQKQRQSKSGQKCLGLKFKGDKRSHKLRKWSQPVNEAVQFFMNDYNLQQKLLGDVLNEKQLHRLRKIHIVQSMKFKAQLLGQTQ